MSEASCRRARYSQSSLSCGVARCLLLVIASAAGESLSAQAKPGDAASYVGHVHVNGSPFSKGRVILYPPAYYNGDAAHQPVETELGKGGAFSFPRPSERWSGGMRNWVRAEVRTSDHAAVDYTYLSTGGDRVRASLGWLRTPPVAAGLEFEGIHEGPYSFRATIDSVARTTMLATGEGSYCIGAVEPSCCPSRQRCRGAQ